jgi:hypothetical protein
LFAPQAGFDDRPIDVVAVITNCFDLHPRSRIDVIKELRASTPDLRVHFFGDCGDLGRYDGSKMVRYNATYLVISVGRGQCAYFTPNELRIAGEGLTSFATCAMSIARFTFNPGLRDNLSALKEPVDD